MRKWIFGVIAAVSLTACGVAYVSPQVSATDGKVRVVPLSADSVLVANRDTYTPKQIPNAFFQNAGSAGALRSAGAAPPPSLSEQQRPATLAARIPPPVNPGPYRIGVGDVVLLATKSAGTTVEELSGLLAAQNSRQGYTVQDDGAIAVPDVGRINLEGLTLEEAEAQLFQSLVENRIDPTFSLEIAEFNSQRVSLGGAVATPIVVPITLTPLRLDEALTRAGGIATADVDFASIRIYRDGTLYQIPLTQYLSEPELQKTRLAAGDSVFVDTAFELEKARAYFEEQITLSQFRQQGRSLALAQLNTEIELRRAALTETRVNFQDRITLDAVDRDYVYLTGEVTQPGRFAMPFGQQTTLADALYSDGGFSSETGNPAQIYVLRSAEADFGAVTAWHLDARNVTNLLLATRMNLLPNDIIFIAEQPITRWNRVVQQLVPSLITSGVGIASR
ncbi:polysaccharide biosynthesis/export family protein [Yoonia sp. F2084L]|uniref:polysaccharide biosynthesis/export family protein n=1 Tax=Yoonia sp. F2084L TaxID=2926419 RepID=UPI001FF3F852|nr:polysaccharide biosynthesis/export family protein [Yoonia sp. F2084L]MCK0097155.1 polysaccharide biosynthesis/export family protein [Yoonia sp. F2084L]